MNRRRYLATAATAAFAGCSAIGIGGNKFAAAQDPWSQDDDKELSNGYRYSGVVKLPSNRYAQISLDPEIPFELKLSAKSTSPMDFYVLDENEFNRYRDEKEFQYYQKFTAINTPNPEFSGELGAGKYHVIFDNAEFTGAQPDGQVRSEYTVKQTV